MLLVKQICTFAITALLLIGDANIALAQKGGGGGSSGRSSFSGGSSGRSSFSGGSSGRSSTTSNNSGSNKPSPSFSGGSSKPSQPINSSTKPSPSFSGGSSSSSKVTTTTTPIQGKTPTSVSTKPVASNFDSLAGNDAKKAESRSAYKPSEAPAPTYKAPNGKEIKIDPKDKQIENLRGRLSEQRWVNRTQREDSFYHSYAGRPIVMYSDCYHPYWNYWLMSQSIDIMAMWCYHHQMSMDQMRLNEMYAQNAGLRAKVAALEAQKITRDPNYMPSNVDPDLAYNDAYINAIYNPRPKVITEYQYNQDGPGVGTVLLWIFVYIPLTIVVILTIYYFVFAYRW